MNCEQKLSDDGHKKTRNYSELSTYIMLIEMTVQRNQNLIKF